MSPGIDAQKARVKHAKIQHPAFGPGQAIGEGDSSVIYDAFRDSTHLPHNGIDYSSETFFDDIKNEVHWQKMYHAQGEVPRLVCAQGIIDKDGSMPVYRHPADESLPLLHFSPIIDGVRKRVEEIVGHRINHALVQLYRDGKDFISEHSDKTLDIVRNTKIVNVSFGAQRTMRLRTKKSASVQNPDGSFERRTQLIPLPHSSVFTLGWETNMRWLHSINADKRPSTERSESELAFGGERISLTFRNIGTFLSPQCDYIWGQGAVSKDHGHPRAVINGDPDQSQHLINMFGMENQQSQFDWDQYYGSGFDVLHFSKHDTREIPLLFLQDSFVADVRVISYLEHLQMRYKITGVRSQDAGSDFRPKICFRDIDTRKTHVEGDIATIFHLYDTYAGTNSDGQSNEMLRKLVTSASSGSTSSSSSAIIEHLRTILMRADNTTGEEPSLLDFLCFPLLQESFDDTESDQWLTDPLLKSHFLRISQYGCFQKALIDVSYRTDAS